MYESPRGGPETKSQLTAIINELTSARERLGRLEAKVPSDRWPVRHDPRRWSVGECVVHINLTSKAFIPLVAAALDNPSYRDVPAPGRYRRDVIGWMLYWFVGPVPRIGRVELGRVKTAAAFVPEGNIEKSVAIAEFDALQHELIELTRRCDGRPIDRMRVVSPFDSRAGYNVYSALVIIPRHQQRHLIQAERVWDR